MCLWTIRIYRHIVSERAREEIADAKGAETNFADILSVSGMYQIKVVFPFFTRDGAV